MKIMPKISVVIITLNEERNIARCITSVLPFADEVVVIDSLSSDSTVEIAEEMGAKVIKQAFLGHIEQKNFALTHTSTSYIFSLDADEEVSERLCESILKVKNDWTADAYSMNRLTNYCGQWIRHSGWYPDTKIRLFDKGKAKWGGRNPHDKIILDNDSGVLKLDGDLLHYSYYSISEHIKQMDKFSDIAAKAMYEEDKNVSFYKLYLSHCFKFMRNYFLKLGFLDGFYGYTICRIAAFETFLKYARLHMLRKKSDKSGSI
jgi:glycosyltransferase involved in cell wall biosynthesis